MTNKYHYLRDDVIEHLQSGTLIECGEGSPTRFAYADEILEVAADNPNVVVLDADVSKSIQTNHFAEQYPERSFNFGIAEQNMVAAAAGMATTGLIPFATSYAVFLTMRALDQVRNAVHYPHLNVKFASSHGGITPGPDGPTHQGQEDLALMRALAGSTILAAADYVSTRKATRAAAEFVGPVYLSFTRDPVPDLYTGDFPLEIGKAVVIRDGTDATIVAIRDLVSQSLVAAEMLKAEGLDVRVIDSYCLKPLDEDTIIRAATETGALVTAESGIKFGGLGSAVAEVLVENCPVPMQRVAMQDRFAESGPYLAVLDKYGLSARYIADAVRQVIARKL